MREENKLREDIAFLAKSLFDRGLTCGSSGNISARLEDGRLLVTPTGSCMGWLDPAKISLIGLDGQHLGGDKPTKELNLHTAFYDTRGSKAGAVVHLHSTHSVALSTLPDVDADNFIPPMTPYSIMRVGRVKLLPYFRPGDPAMGDAVRELEGQRAAVVLANHGPVVSAKDLQSAVFAMEELEETAKLALLTRSMNPRMLTQDQIEDLQKVFGTP